MPELPEVEIVKQSLEKNILSKRIKKIIVNNRNLRFKIPTNFEERLENKVIVKVSRFSKYIIFELSNQIYLLMHLGMTGTVHLIKKNKIKINTNVSFYSSPNLPKKHNHVEIFFLSSKIIYNDPRRFGFFRIIENKDELFLFLNKLGPEPFDKSFNLKYLHEYFRDKTKNIKNFLLDQKLVSGIGNIYASEILHYSGIKPQKKGGNLKKKELIKVIFFAKKVLKKSIKSGGSSIKDFKNISGKKGFFQNEFKVYGRENLKCYKKSCTGVIQKKFISNRSTFFCNKCQK